MSKHNFVKLAGREKIRDELMELIRDGACKLIAQGLDLEVSELLSALCGQRPCAGSETRRGVLRWSGMAISRSERFRPALAR